MGGRPGPVGAREGRARVFRAALDIAMVALLLFQMTRQFLPGAMHEVTGVAFAVLVVAHNVLNRRWYASLLRGPWTLRRAVPAAVNAVLVLVCLGAVACGLGMSGVAVGLGVAGHAVVLRSVHMTLVHWLFVLAGVHLGLHARQLARRVGRAFGAPGSPMRPFVRRAAMLGTAALVAYGAYAFVKLGFFGYLSGRTRFAFIDPSQPVLLFVFDHLAVLTLCAAVGCGASWALRRSGGRKGSPTKGA